MCLHPLRVPNKGYRPENFFTQRYIDVNCNHCWQCKLQRQNDYCFRLQYECLSRNAIPFFVTLTYSDKYLPYLQYRRASDNGFECISCWNRSHVQKLNKIIRRQLEYYYGVKNVLSYLCCCERGSDRLYVDSNGRIRKATNRPHYHLLYLLYLNGLSPVRPLPSAFYDFCRYKCSSPSPLLFVQFLVSDRWIYGMIDDVAFCRDTTSITKYITKYITKDINEPLFSVTPQSACRLIDPALYNRYCELKSIKHESDIVSYLSSKYARSSYPCVRLSSLFPRAMCSINLGMGFVENLSQDELLDYLSGKKHVTLSSRTSSSLIDLPFYYFKRLCKSVSQIPYNISFSRFDGRRWKMSFSEPVVYAKHEWDSLRGYYKSYLIRSYTESSLSLFGNAVMREKVLLRYNKFLSKVSQYMTVDTDKLLSLGRSLPELSDLFDFYAFDRSFKLYTPTFYEFFSGCHFGNNSSFNNLYNFVALCSSVQSHLSHLAYQSTYRSKLGAAAKDNPDLFLTHFI